MHSNEFILANRILQHNIVKILHKYYEDMTLMGEQKRKSRNGQINHFKPEPRTDFFLIDDTVR